MSTMDAATTGQGYERIAEDIRRIAAACRAEGQYAKYDSQLPSVLVHRGTDDEYHFQEHEAQDLVTSFEACAELADKVDFEDWLIWYAQGW